MSVFTIADLHLSTASDHPMDVFGSRWEKYTEKICKNWRALVKSEDTVIIPGDISWGMTLKEAQSDFALLDSLPGQKLLGKGNHDFWWTTASKANLFWKENGFSTLRLLYNNAYVIEDYIVCGTRGWFLEESQQITVGDVDYQKIVNREVLRLRLSLQAAKALQVGENAEKEIVVFLHFPPLWNSFRCDELIEVLHEYGIKRCFFGHIHGSYQAPSSFAHEDTTFYLISSDHLNFIPRLV